MALLEKKWDPKIGDEESKSSDSAGLSGSRKKGLFLLVKSYYFSLLERHAKDSTLQHMLLIVYPSPHNCQKNTLGLNHNITQLGKCWNCKMRKRIIYLRN